jgi:hypothetical protein
MREHGAMAAVEGPMGSVNTLTSQDELAYRGIR